MQRASPGYFQPLTFPSSPIWLQCLCMKGWVSLAASQLFRPITYWIHCIKSCGTYYIKWSSMLHLLKLTHVRCALVPEWFSFLHVARTSGTLSPTLRRRFCGWTKLFLVLEILHHRGPIPLLRKEMSRLGVCNWEERRGENPLCLWLFFPSFCWIRVV